MFYSKKYTSPTDLIALLQTRGLIINDESKAINHIKRIGYYRLSAYSKIFSLKENEKENIKKTYTDFFNKAFQNSQFSKVNSVDVSIDGTVYVAKQYSLNLNKNQAKVAIYYTS